MMWILIFSLVFYEWLVLYMFLSTDSDSESMAFWPSEINCSSKLRSVLLFILMYIFLNPLFTIRKFLHYFINRFKRT